jgi:hypothetical protein
MIDEETNLINNLSGQLSRRRSVCRQWGILDPKQFVNVCFRHVVLKYSDYSAKLRYFD